MDCMGFDKDERGREKCERTRIEDMVVFVVDVRKNRGAQWFDLVSSMIILEATNSRCK